MKRQRVISILVSLAMLASIAFSTVGEVSTSSAKKETVKKSRSETELIVKYNDETKDESIKASVKTKLKLKKLESKKSRKSKTEIMTIDDADNIDSVISELQSDSNVLSVQKNYELTTDTTPVDSRYSEQWGLNNVAQSVNGQTGTPHIDINAEKAWDITTGSQTVKVGVLDTGIDINHPDLANSIFHNTAEIAGNGIDDEGNGYIDDVTGYDFANNDATVFDSASSDTHGTHVAGIIAGQMNNLGICGVAPNVKIVPLKFISGSTGYTSDAIEAIEYAKTIGIKIINCSFGGSDNNPALKDEMQNSNILFICAAGNSGSNSCIYPAAFGLPNVLSVGAIDNTGNLASFSNYGSSVSIACPGVNILSTLPNNSYGYLSGTSMAAPFGTGIASLLLSQNSNLTAQAIKTQIEQTTNMSRGRII